ncbi:beta-lactamase family protein [Lederbergia sp. NSJ-179]|uniref:serine hydrolase domain-containing protein n=1 Tax=Lederbergia sp. NSJ-179 TaxID=2931402 RepID=UPI001FD422BE|nr:serine hydrolase domain-containing protein [Lederbergia sp. NSJ-179]MCJ7841536.1 beta-lactamase family protein [Lederbergia sp. NSJ-179]
MHDKKKDESLKEKVLRFLAQEISAEHIPGAAIYVAKNGQTILQETIGARTLHPSPQPVEEATVYDLASLTKVVATLPSMLKLMEEGAFHLKDRVSRFIPGFEKNGKEDVTIQHLLTHTSGLAAHRPFYNEKLTKGEVVQRICTEKLMEKLGKKVIYSDLGFILLSTIIENIAQQSFESFVERYIFSPLEMKDTGFNLPFKKDRFAATEFSDELKDYKYGVVHDENAEAMGGVSGHAGLFSSLPDLVKFSTMIENEGVYNHKRILTSSVLRLARKNFTPYDQEGRGLGWQLQSEGTLASGDLLSDDAYGHTGYTGTSIWFDPQAKLTVILLTNRVHAQNKNGILRLRPRLHNVIQAHLQS